MQQAALPLKRLLVNMTDRQAEGASHPAAVHHARNHEPATVPMCPRWRQHSFAPAQVILHAGCAAAHVHTETAAAVAPGPDILACKALWLILSVSCHLSPEGLPCIRAQHLGCIKLCNLLCACVMQLLGCMCTALLLRGITLGLLESWSPRHPLVKQEMLAFTRHHTRMRAPESSNVMSRVQQEGQPVACSSAHRKHIMMQKYAVREKTPYVLWTQGHTPMPVQWAHAQRQGWSVRTVSVRHLCNALAACGSAALHRPCLGCRTVS